MAIDVDDLRAEVNAGPSSDNALLARCVGLAQQLITTYLEDNLEAEEVADLPTEVVDEATLKAAADLFHQAKAPNGVVMQEYDVGDGTVGSTPIRIGRDPLRSARPVLELYVGPAIG